MWSRWNGTTVRLFCPLSSPKWNCSKWTVATASAPGRGMCNRMLLFEARSQRTFPHSSLWLVTCDFLPRVFFLFQSKRNEDSPLVRVYVRLDSSSSKASESIWAPRCWTSWRSAGWGFGKDGIYRRLLYFSECLVGHSSKKTDVAFTQREHVEDCGIKKLSEG